MKTVILSLMILASCSDEMTAPTEQGALQDEQSSKKTATVADTAAGKENSTDNTVVIADSATVINDLGVDERPAKLTAENCIDPDLTLVYKDVVLTMCDGSTGVGTYQPVQFDNLVAENIKAGVEIGGVTGNVVVESHMLCTGGNQVGCVTTATYKSADLTNLAAENVKAGVNINGISGTYNNRPVDCNANNLAGCVTTTTYKSADLTNLAAGNIKSGIGLAGITGTYDNRPADCSASAQVGCVSTSTYKSADLSNLSAGVIKSGVVVAGVTGQYPSTSYPLPVPQYISSSIPHLDLATFDAKLKSASSFEWFDSAGNHYYRDGDADLANAGNIKDSVTIFGTVGTAVLVGDAAASINPRDVRKGTSILGVAGNLTPACRDSEGSTSAPCEDWTLVAGDCSTLNGSCIYRDENTQLTWTRILSFTAATSADAKTVCETSSYRNIVGWRLPSKAEALQAVSQGMRAHTAPYMTYVQGTGASSVVWTDTGSVAAGYAAVNMTTGAVTTSTNYVMCVK